MFALPTRQVSLPSRESMRAWKRFIAGEPMKRRDEEVRRLVVELLRRALLLEHAFAHDRDPRAHRHRLDLVVRHVDRRRRRARAAASRSRPASALEASRRGSRAARPSGRPAARRTIARPIATRCRWPPESVRGRRLSMLRQPEQPRRPLDALADLALRAAAGCAAGRRCSRRRSCAGRARSSGRPSRCRACAARRVDHARPPIRISPSVISSSPATIRSAVVLPQPDGPTRTMNSPSAISRLRSVDGPGAVRIDLADAVEARSTPQAQPLHPAAEAADQLPLREQEERAGSARSRSPPPRR